MALCGTLEGGLVLPAPERTEIYRTVRLLAGYARGDHALDAPVQEYLISLIPLWSAPLVDPSSIGEVGLDTRSRRGDPCRGGARGARGRP